MMSQQKAGGNRQSAIVIDLLSDWTEMDQRGTAPRHGGVAATAAGAREIVELLSDDNNDTPPKAMERPRRRKRQRDSIGIIPPPLQDNDARGRLKDCDNDGLKIRVQKDQNRNYIDLMPGGDDGTIPPPRRDKNKERVRLKDYDEDGRKVRAQEDKKRSYIDLTPGGNDYVNSSTLDIMDLMSGGNDEQTTAAMPLRQVIPESLPPELQVLEVYPDADEDAVKGLLQRNEQKVDLVVAIMTENGYKTSSVPRTTASLNQENGITVSMSKKTNDWSYDFMAVDSFIPSATYVKEVKNQLLYDFPFLTSVGVDVIMDKHSNHYAKAHDFVITILKGTGDEETKFSRLDGVIRGAYPSDEQAKQLNSHSNGRKTRVVCKRKSSKPKSIPLVNDEILAEEISYAHGKLREYLQNGRKHESVEKKKAAAQKSNTAIDCACCFDGYDIDDMVACRQEGHLFCLDCLRAYAENQIFGVGNLGVDRMTKKPAHELKCFHGDCYSGFDRRTLEKALPQRTLETYDRIQSTLALQTAGLECMIECPKCGFQVELPSNQRILVCPVGSCKYESCRECGEAAHIPLRCDEVEKKVETTGRIIVEEAISQAKIRHCPKCKKAFLKESGCNKISCGCGHKMCELSLQKTTIMTIGN